MADKSISLAANAVGAQRSKTSPAHQAVPADATSVAGSAVTSGDAAPVSGATVTVVGKGLLAHAGQMGPRT